MRIIKQGKVPNRAVVQYTCNTCESIIEVAKEENCEETGIRFRFRCPVCSEHQWIYLDEFFKAEQNIKD